MTAKPIVLLLEEGHAYAFLVRGLHTVADVTCLNIGDTESLATEVVRRVPRGTAVAHVAENLDL